MGVQGLEHDRPVHERVVDDQSQAETGHPQEPTALGLNVIPFCEATEGDWDGSARNVWSVGGP